jgi:hypothetical protein
MSMLRTSLRELLIICFLLVPAAVRAQITNIGDDTSVPISGVGHDYIKMLDETVNPANGSVSLRIQVPVPKGRGLTIPFGINYDSNGVNHLIGGANGSGVWRSNTAYLAQGGWSYGVPQLNSIGYSVAGGTPPGPTWTCSYSSSYMFQDASGGRHPLFLGAGSVVYESGSNVCNPSQTTGGDETTVATLSVSAGYAIGATVSDPDGTVYRFSNPANHFQGNYESYTDLPSSIEDRNGNIIVITDNNNGAFTIADSVGRTAISSSGFGPSGTTNTISVSGFTQPYQITWETVPSNFSVPVKAVSSQLPGYCEAIGGVNYTQVVVKSITLPNGQSYQFFYECPGTSIRNLT